MPSLRDLGDRLFSENYTIPTGFDLLFPNLLPICHPYGIWKTVYFPQIMPSLWDFRDGLFFENNKAPLSTCYIFILNILPHNHLLVKVFHLKQLLFYYRLFQGKCFPTSPYSTRQLFSCHKTSH